MAKRPTTVMNARARFVLAISKRRLHFGAPERLAILRRALELAGGDRGDRHHRRRPL
jgi:hypothetical protein